MRPTPDAQLTLTLNHSGILELPFSPPSLHICLALGLGPHASSLQDEAPEQLPADLRAQLGLDVAHGSVISVQKDRLLCARALDPDEAVALAQLLIAAGVPAEPPELTVADNATGDRYESVALAGQVDGHPVALRYGGMLPYRLRGPGATEWQAFLDALLHAAGAAAH